MASLVSTTKWTSTRELCRQKLTLSTLLPPPPPAVINTGPFHGPAVGSIVSFNCEGYSSQKEELISDLCAKNNCSVLCLQETHHANESQAINIQGYILVSEIKHAKHGSAILVKENILPESTQAMVHDEIEFLSVTLNNLTVTSIYKPPPVILSFPDNFFNFDCSNIIIGDLNCHNHVWGYDDSNDNGIYLVEWLTANQLSHS